MAAADPHASHPYKTVRYDQKTSQYTAVDKTEGMDAAMRAAFGAPLTTVLEPPPEHPLRQAHGMTAKQLIRDIINSVLYEPALVVPIEAPVDSKQPVESPPPQPEIVLCDSPPPREPDRLPKGFRVRQAIERLGPEPRRWDGVSAYFDHQDAAERIRNSQALKKQRKKDKALRVAAAAAKLAGPAAVVALVSDEKARGVECAEEARRKNAEDLKKQHAVDERGRIEAEKKAAADKILQADDARRPKITYTSDMKETVAFIRSFNSKDGGTEFNALIEEMKLRGVSIERLRGGLPSRLEELNRECGAPVSMERLWALYSAILRNTPVIMLHSRDTWVDAVDAERAKLATAAEAAKK